jgi:signal transduction histidine kinase
VHAGLAGSGYYRFMVDSLTRTLRRFSATAQDAALAVGLTLFGVVGLAWQPGFGPHREGGHPPGFPPGREFVPREVTATPFGPFGNPSPWAYAVIAFSFLPLALRRKYPLAILGVTTAGAVLYEIGHFPPSIAFAAPLVALYTVASVRDRNVAIAGALVSAAAQLGAAWFSVGSSGLLTEAVRIVALTGAAAALGDATRNRRAYVAEVEQRARFAERTRDEEARRRVDEERLRIARELHDVTAHSLSIIAVQSGAAAHVIDTDTEEARRSLEAIRRTSKQALDELRAMLGVLRASGESDAPLAPAPGLARLGELVAPLADAGFEVTSNVARELGEMPSIVEGSAYRIAQEALTNVVRHAGLCRVWLSVSRDADALVVSVEDDGRTPELPLSTDGHGLDGMRERAVALGGTFAAVPRAGGGFVVTARLPIARSAGAS